MDDKQLQALANELAKNLKTPEDLSQFDRLLKKISVEAALNAELTHHLGHEKNQPKSGTNSRNGYSTKTVTTTDGPMELRTPRDRDGSFEPQLVKKNQTRITGMDNQILALTSRSWRANWPNIATFFVYPEAIRKVIYTTNAIESLNSVIRHAIKKRKVFPTDESVKKVVWLAIQSASQKWTMPLQDWRIAMSRFIIEFGDRLDGHF
ncbi:transposase [Escherichia coli]|uniref:transposase n=1 Tax=Escherichia coli TaxID=562 RepID=UPI0032DAC256